MRSQTKTAKGKTSAKAGIRGPRTGRNHCLNNSKKSGSARQCSNRIEKRGLLTGGGGMAKVEERKRLKRLRQKKKSQ